MGTQLVIDPVSLSHDGTFVCANENLESTIEITILQIPEVSMNLANTVNVNYGGSLDVHCNSTGNPNPIVQINANEELFDISILTFLLQLTSWLHAAANVHQKLFLLTNILGPIIEFRKI